MDAVLNWIWQGLAVAIALSLMLRAITGVSATVRYAVCGLALAIVLALPALWSVSTATIGSRNVPVLATSAIVAVPDSPLTSPVTLLLAWLVWVVTQAAIVTWSLLSARRIRQASRPFPADVERRLHHWMRLRGQRRQARLVVSDRVGRAAMLGCGAPMIAIAPQLLDRLSDEDLDRVVLHEWAHVQRRDDLANLLQLALRVVAGWHPAVWWIDRRLRIEREVACDEMAVALGGSPKSYATCLVNLSEVPTASPIPLAAAGVLTPGGLRYRVTRIIANRTFMSPRRSRGVAAAMVAALLVLATGIGPVELFADTWALPDPVQTLRRSLPLPLGRPRPATATLIGARQAAPTRKTNEPGDRDVQGVPARTPDVVPTAEGKTEPVAATPTQDAVRAISVSAPPTNADQPILESQAAVPAAAAPAVVPAPTDSRSTWVAAADAGVAIGRGSKAAGVATAGAFTRFARRVAGSF